MTSHAAKILACFLIVSGTVIGLAGIDLILPSIPDLPLIFNTGIGPSQMVLASYVGGASIGFLVFGILASRMDRRVLFLGSVAAFGLMSFLCLLAEDIWVLVGLRFIQGAVSTAPAVIAPGMIRQIFSEIGAVRAISLLGSIESLVPALAPILGVWLSGQFGWTASFWLTAGLALVICLVLLRYPRLLPGHPAHSSRDLGGYGKLLKNKTYLRYGMSHACVLGGLLVFVFSLPVVIIETMGGRIDNFIYIQVCGVTSFIIMSNLTGTVVKHYGAELAISLGTTMATCSALFLVIYAGFGGNDPWVLIPAFIPLNAGLGLRGGPGFMKALEAAEHDDARGSALIILAVTVIASLGTAALAPFISSGLFVLTVVVALIILTGWGLIKAIAPLKSGV
ncbi:MAG: MFS transporter [Alphaproteobacteria bacterium]|nr:MAG: MFS transporter [Alphaproteobacteria bacterium]